VVVVTMREQVEMMMMAVMVLRERAAGNQAQRQGG
jgi:hypothetical protein